MIPAARILETTSQLIPTGQAQDVKDSPFDFSTCRSIGAHLYLSLIHISLNYEIIGKSDEEITKLASSNPSELNIEELLYAATPVSYTHLDVYKRQV